MNDLKPAFVRLEYKTLILISAHLAWISTSDRFVLSKSEAVDDDLPIIVRLYDVDSVCCQRQEGYQKPWPTHICERLYKRGMRAKDAAQEQTISNPCG